MQIIITGGAGFLGQRLAQALLKSELGFEELLLADIILPLNPSNDNRVTCQKVDLSQEHAAKKFSNLQNRNCFSPGGGGKQSC